MNVDEQKEKQIQWRKGLRTIQNDSRLDECFHFDQDECQGVIKQAHSLQRNGVLSLIEGEVNGNEMIYTPTSYSVDSQYPIKSLIPIGKKQASTFYGFCDFHDSKLFASIENFPFDDSDEHCFLHSYRSFAHTNHRKKEEHKAFTTSSYRQSILSPTDLLSSQAGVEMGLSDFNYYRPQLNSMLAQKRFSDLEYFVHSFPASYPVAFASAFTPYFTPKGYEVNPTHDVEAVDRFRIMMLTVFPTADETIVIFACFPEDEPCVSYLDELEKIKNARPERLKSVISAIMLSAGENLFFAPGIWNALGQKGQRQLCDELITIVRDTPQRFQQTKINFFAPSFTRARLGMS